MQHLRLFSEDHSHNINIILTTWKVPIYGVISGPYFPVFGLNTEIYWKVSKYGIISGPYFPVLQENAGKYRPEITPYLDTFHAVTLFH